LASAGTTSPAPRHRRHTDGAGMAGFRGPRLRVVRPDQHDLRAPGRWPRRGGRPWPGPRRQHRPRVCHGALRAPDVRHGAPRSSVPGRHARANGMR